MVGWLAGWLAGSIDLLTSWLWLAMSRLQWPTQGDHPPHPTQHPQHKHQAQTSGVGFPKQMHGGPCRVADRQFRGRLHSASEEPGLGGGYIRRISCLRELDALRNLCEETINTGHCTLQALSKLYEQLLNHSSTSTSSN